MEAVGLTIRRNRATWAAWPVFSSVDGLGLHALVLLATLVSACVRVGV